MAEVTRQRIKSIYSQINGYLKSLPGAQAGYAAPISATENYNRLLDQLDQLTETSFESYKISQDRNSYNEYGYDINAVRMSMSAVVERLNDDYNFSPITPDQGNSPIVITVNQNQQQLSMTVISISKLIGEQEDEDLKEILNDLDTAAKKKDEGETKSILKTLADRSWSLFLRVLPYILETWGQSHNK